MEIVNTAAGGGRRTLWDAGLMDAYYDPPGVVFEAATDHDHDTDYPVAECRKEVGEKLCERAHIEPLAAVVDGEDDQQASDETENSAAYQAGRDVARAVGDTSDLSDVDGLTETQRRIDSADHEELRAVAGELDAVNGNQSTADLRVALHTDVDEDAVAEAFAAADAETDAEADDEEEN